MRGIKHEYYPRSRYTYHDYPKLYANLDCVVNFSLMATGPHCLFESLASGIPVVSSSVGWATTLLKNGKNGYIANSVDEITTAVKAIQTDRQGWFLKRQAIRASLGPYTLESWLDENISCVTRMALHAAA